MAENQLRFDESTFYASGCDRLRTASQGHENFLLNQQLKQDIPKSVLAAEVLASLSTAPTPPIIRGTLWMSASALAYINAKSQSASPTTEATLAECPALRSSLHSLGKAIQSHPDKAEDALKLLSFITFSEARHYQQHPELAVEETRLAKKIHQLATNVAVSATQHQDLYLMYNTAPEPQL